MIMWIVYICLSMRNEVYAMTFMIPRAEGNGWNKTQSLGVDDGEEEKESRQGFLARC